MKLYYFSEMPHHEYPDAEGDKYPSLRLAFPNTFFSPEIAQRNYQRYLALAREAATEGDAVQTEHWYQHAEHYFRMMKERTA